MVATRGASVVLLVVAALALQVGLFSQLAISGVVPNLALLVVIGAAIVRGPQYGAVLGFCTGIVVDLAPPADHVAGRWALAFVIAAYLAGLVRKDASESATAAVATVAGCSFVATSLFALSGLVIGDPGVTVARVFTVVPLGVLYDVVIAPVVMPLVLLAFRRLDSRPLEVRANARDRI